MIYRLEAGQDVTVSSLLAVLAALGLVLRVDKADLPTMLPEKIPQLKVLVAYALSGQLIKYSNDEFRYQAPRPDRLAVGLAHAGQFGRRVCEVSHPQQVLERIAQAMDAVLLEARGDARISRALIEQMESAWRSGVTCSTYAWVFHVKQYGL